jgi:uncharacterized membrane protein YgcG
MKNIFWILSASVVFTLSSCISTAQFNNAEDDVYYSPKASNRKQPVIIPEVNVDEIIKKNPPQYGQPTNRVDDVTPNPNAAEGYRAYKMQQDSAYTKDPTLSGYYVNTNLPNSETDEINRRNNRWLNRSFNNRNRWNNWGNWNYGLGWNSWSGIGLGVGFNNWGNNWGWNNWGNNNWGNNWGCNNWGNNWGWNDFYGCNTGWGWNNWGWGNPYHNGFWGWGNSPIYYNNDRGNSNNNNTNQPISMPRPSVGSTAPPANSGGQPTNSGGRNFQATPQGNTQPPDPTTPTNYGRQYTPANGEQRLENVNGRTIYTRPQEVVQPVQTTNPNSNPGFQRAPDNNYNQPSQGFQRQPNNDSRGSFSPAPSAPSNIGGGRGSAPSGGGGRSSGGGSSVGGRRR